MACVAIAWNGTWQALQQEGWNDDALAKLQGSWSSCDLIGDAEHAFVMERALGLDLFRQVHDSSDKLAFLIGQRETPNEFGFPSGFSTSGFVLHRLHAPFWRFAWMDQDALRDLDRWQAMIERFRIAQTNGLSELSTNAGGWGPTNRVVWKLYFETREHLGWYDQLRYLISSEPFGLGDNTTSKILGYQTQQQMMLAAIAIARHQLRHGGVPTSLKALVPEYLPILPKDWMDGKPLRYEPKSAHTYLLYSVGEDGKDDGGDPSPTQANQKARLIWNGLDAVWPVPASDEEAQAAFME